MTVERPIPEFTNHNWQKQTARWINENFCGQNPTCKARLALVLLLVRLKTSVTFLCNSRSIEITIAQLLPPVIWKLLCLFKTQEITTLFPLGLIMISLNNPTLSKVDPHAFSSTLLSFVSSSAKPEISILKRQAWEPMIRSVQLPY